MVIISNSVEAAIVQLKDEGMLQLFLVTERAYILQLPGVELCIIININLIESITKHSLSRQTLGKIKIK